MFIQVWKTIENCDNTCSDGVIRHDRYKRDFSRKNSEY